MKELTESQRLKKRIAELKKQIAEGRKKIEKAKEVGAHLERELIKSCERGVAEIMSGKITGKRAIRYKNDLLTIKKQYPHLLAHIEI